MLIALALSVQVMAAAPVSYQPRELHLLAQADFAPPPPVAANPADLEQSISQLNARIVKMRGNWPAGALVLAWVGFSLAPVLLAGLPLLILGIGIGADSFGIGPVFLLLGGGLTFLGLLGLAAGIIGVVYGSNAVADEKAERLELIRQRDELQRQLDQMRAVPPAVRVFPSTQSLVTVAVF